MTPEGKVKRKIKLWYDLNLPNHWRVSPRGGPFGKEGTSDDIICWLGFFISVEVKSDSGTVSPLQMKSLKDVVRAGGVAAVVRGYDVAKLELIKATVQKKHEAMMRGLE